MSKNSKASGHQDDEGNIMSKCQNRVPSKWRHQMTCAADLPTSVSHWSMGEMWRPSRQRLPCYIEIRGDVFGDEYRVLPGPVPGTVQLSMLRQSILLDAASIMDDVAHSRWSAKSVAPVRGGHYDRVTDTWAPMWVGYYDHEEERWHPEHRLECGGVTLSSYDACGSTHHDLDVEITGAQYRRSGPTARRPGDFSRFVNDLQRVAACAGLPG